MSESLIVKGGNPLRGTVEPIVNKNSVLPTLVASLLSSSRVRYTNIPDTTDQKKLLDLMQSLGAEVTVHDAVTGDITILAKNLNQHDITSGDGGTIRASLLFVGPLLARFGRAVVPLPGGCTLGFRGVGSHVELFQKAGAHATIKGDTIEFVFPKDAVIPKNIFSREASVTATENILLFLAGQPTTVTLYGIATEPHIVDLCTLLSGMGVIIEGAGTNRITITGRLPEDLVEAECTNRFDFVDFSGYAVAAAVTNGEITIKNANDPSIIDPVVNWLEPFGVEFSYTGNDVTVRRGASGILRIDHMGTFPMASRKLPKLYPQPWPGFPVDCIPPMLVLASCMSEGKLMLLNWMYEDGLQLTRELQTMGASIFVSSPQRVVIDGADSSLSGVHELHPPRVIQSVKAIFLAALASEKGSVSTIHHVDLLRRRYPDLVKSYQSLGADIEIVM